VQTSCPTCGAPVEDDQLVCLNCGGRVGLSYRRPPRWQIPVLLATAVVALATAGVFHGLRAVTDEADEEVAAGPASRREAAQRDEPGARTPPPAATTPRAEEPRDEESDALAAAKRTPTAVLSGVPTPRAAAREAARLRRRGFRITQVANAPSPAERSAVLFAPGAREAARELARAAGIRTVRPVDPATAGTSGGARLYVIVGSRR